MSATKKAEAVAKETFQQYLIAARATATMRVPQSVIDAAQKAYAEAGGTGEIEVIGSGNTTHPVCSVSVRRAKARR